METHALSAKRLLLLQRHGALSTASASHEGYPFGSLAPYDIDEEGRIIMYVSLIAEHYRNLKRDPRASLLVTDLFVRGDALVHARATALLDFVEVPASESDDVRRRYECRFPGSIQYEIAHNFVFLRSAVKKLRWIGGFGEISWVSGDELSHVPFDPVAYGGYGIIEHMIDDHRDALCDMVEARTGKRPPLHGVVMSGVWSEGMAIRVYGADGVSVENLSFDAPCESPDAVRGAVIRLLKSARQELAARKT
jgi:hypothetical protein